MAERHAPAIAIQGHAANAKAAVNDIKIPRAIGFQLGNALGALRIQIGLGQAKILRFLDGLIIGFGQRIHGRFEGTNFFHYAAERLKHLGHEIGSRKRFLQITTAPGQRAKGGHLIGIVTAQLPDQGSHGQFTRRARGLAKTDCCLTRCGKAQIARGDLPIDSVKLLLHLGHCAGLVPGRAG